MTAAAANESDATLKSQVESLLKKAGFVNYRVSSHGGSCVDLGLTCAGIPSSPGVCCGSLGLQECSLLLAAYAIPLRAEGLVVRECDTYLFVDQLRSTGMLHGSARQHGRRSKHDEQ